jgi:hypothetical protein
MQKNLMASLLRQLMAEGPLAKVRVRWSQLSFSFWNNEKKIPGITLTKSWKDDGGQWHNQNISVTRRDLVELAHQLPRVLDLYDKTSSDLRDQSGGSTESSQDAPRPQVAQRKPQVVSEETYEFVD